MPRPASRIQVPWGPHAAALGTLALLLVAGMGAATLVGLIAATDYTADDYPLSFVLASTLVLQLGLLIVAFVLGPLRWGAFGRLLGHRQLTTPSLFGWAAIAFFGSLVLSAAYVLIAGAISERLVPEPLPGGIDFTEMAVASFVSIAVIAPFAEEVFFRGFLFAGLAKRYGFWAAAIISAAVFGIFHLELARLVPAMFSGIVFAAVYWRSGSVWPAVVAHTTQNAVAFGLAL